MDQQSLHQALGLQVSTKIPAANVLYGESGCGQQQSYLQSMFQ